MIWAWRIMCAVATLLALTACGSKPMRIDRTEGRSLEFFWNSAAKDRTAFYVVETEGKFRSGGGAIATDRGTTFACALSEADIASFMRLTTATVFASRPEESGDAGDRSDVIVREQGKSHQFTVYGVDPAVDALRAWCAEIALRQFRDLIDAQPEAGPRTR